MKPNRGDFPDGPAGEAAYADALRHHREEDTPVLRPRSPSTAVASQLIVEAWMASKPETRMYTGRPAVRGHTVRVIDADQWVDELVGLHEDPYTAMVRAISKLR